MSEPTPTSGRPLKSGEPRRMWCQRLPESTIEAIRDLARQSNLSQSDLVAEAVRRMAETDD